MTSPNEAIDSGSQFNVSPDREMNKKKTVWKQLEGVTFVMQQGLKMTVEKFMLKWTILLAKGAQI